MRKKLLAVLIAVAAVVLFALWNLPPSSVRSHADPCPRPYEQSEAREFWNAIAIKYAQQERPPVKLGYPSVRKADVSDGPHADIVIWVGYSVAIPSGGGESFGIVLKNRSWLYGGGCIQLPDAIHQTF